MNSLHADTTGGWHHEIRRHVEAMLGHEQQAGGSTSDKYGHGPWIRGGLVGFLAMLILFGIGAMTSAGPHNALQESAGVLAAAVLLGGLPGSLAVVFAKVLVRRKDMPPEVTLDELQYKIQQVKARITRPDDVWERMLARCEDSVRAAAEAVAIAPASAATDWLTTLHRSMALELGNAERLARLARAAFPDERITPSAAARAHPLHEQLSRAVADFETSKQGIVDVVARLVRKPDLDAVRAELAMLESQLPVLGEADLG